MSSNYFDKCLIFCENLKGENASYPAGKITL